MKVEIKKVKPRTVKYQYFATFVANLISFSFGSGIGWFSPALPLLISNSSPLESGKLTIDDISWIGAILSLGALFGNLFGGYLVPRFGAKLSITFLAIPQFISWLLLIFGTQASHLEISRFLVGMTGGGLQTSTSIFVSEIADSDVRGRLSTVFSTFLRVGVLFAIVIVSYFDYVKLAVCFTAITVLFYTIFLFLPSTPQHLLKTNKIEKAEKSVQFYKGFQNRKESQTYISEMTHLKLFSDALKEEPKVQLKSFFYEAELRMAIIQALVMTTSVSVAGGHIVLTYGSLFVSKSGTRVPMEIATIIFGIAQLFGALLTGQLIDRKGRKFLLIISMAGCTVGNAILSTYFYLHTNGFDVQSVHWLPVASMIIILISTSVGIGPLTLISLVESFPAKLRPFGVTFGAVMLNVMSFSVSKMFPILSEIIQLQGCMLIFSIVCALSLFYMILFVKETKGKDLNVVRGQNANKTNVIAEEC